MSDPKESMEMEIEISGESSRGNQGMETSITEEKNVMAQGTVSSVTCSLHPLVIMNVSEHWTRERAQEGSVQQGCHL